jgi:hypothetical protein
MSDFTHILSAIEQGDPSAAEQLLALLYDELRKFAVRWLAQEKLGQTMSTAGPTGLETVVPTSLPLLPRRCCCARLSASPR